MRPFRFDAGIPMVQTAKELTEFARRVEALGYTTMSAGDHIAFGVLAPLTTLSLIAGVTTTLRLSAGIFANDLRYPPLLAHEIATLDLLSEGRVQCALGAGWFKSDFDAVGAPFNPPALRFSRLREAVSLIKRLFQEENVTFTGRHYTIQELNLQPKPMQRPYPPLFIGGGGPKILALAAREADIVGIDLRSIPGGMLDMATMTAESIAEKVRWVREAAGPRFDTLDLHINIHHVAITNDMNQGITQVRQLLDAYSPVAINSNLSDTQILESPHFLIGSVEHITEQLHMVRERYGISSFGLFDEGLTSMVSKLAGT